ncbi:hypothetical protein ASG52_19945 [Methylobacterium sp. Leaf456]|uniref:hypothetical protein n=1 Tax=Methylobacterium sp. Leaf456 TaxID=1736382 RepID=UPI0007135843|nr:hypothetical protein [Methylobacterium sp. Leaf456]KQT60000.1 hypothetical protein ASG52_19945 [Methylobacterium sp. Leaf456]
MGEFWTTTRRRSRMDRTCPECGEVIATGQTYVREVGASDEGFVSGLMCEPCHAFADRYLASLRLSGCVNWDEVTFQYGALLDEAAETIGFLWSPDYDGLTPAERRTAMLPILDECDEAERKERARIRALRKASDPSARPAPLAREGSRE